MDRNAQRFIQQQIGFTKSFWITPENAAYYADATSAFIKECVLSANAKGVVIGMSGGLDSAVAGALCARAGIDVHALILPYGDSMKASGSEDRATEISAKFGWATTTHDIQPACEKLSADDFMRSGANSRDVGYAKMNMQAIIRVAKLREIARLENRLLLGTDNLTELILSYFTKDGNGCDFRPLGLFLKRELYLIAPVSGVTESIIIATPSAELFPGQTDESELGFTYNEADDYVEHGTTGNPEADHKIATLIRATQHKRRRPPVYTG